VGLKEGGECTGREGREEESGGNGGEGRGGEAGRQGGMEGRRRDVFNFFFRALSFTSRRLQAAIYWTFKRKAKTDSQATVKIRDVQLAFPGQSETAIRKKLKQCAVFRRGGNQFFFKKYLFLFLSRDFAFCLCSLVSFVQE
jgi:hypothetical protein